MTAGIIHNNKSGEEGGGIFGTGLGTIVNINDGWIYGNDAGASAGAYSQDIRQVLSVKRTIQKILTKEEQIKTEISRVEHTNIGANKEVQTLLESYNSTPLKSGNHSGRTDPPSGTSMKHQPTYEETSGAAMG